MTQQNDMPIARQPIAVPETLVPADAFPVRISPSPDQVLEYIGSVSNAKNEKLFAEIKKRLRAKPEQEICLTVTSGGGPTGAAMSFYGMMREVLKPRLTTVGMGDVDSSGLIVFLAGARRYVHQGTTALLHLAGRRFDPHVRFTARELEAMAREDRLKDAQYAEVVAQNSRGILTAADALSFMERETVLSADELVAYGLADGVLA